MRRTALALLGAAVAIAVAGLAVRHDGAPPAAAPSTGATRDDLRRPRAANDGLTHRGAIGAALRDAAAVAPRAWSPPDSLRDTTPDGALVVDADGHLVIDPALRRFFEYWFAASGEEPEARLRARIEAAIHSRLDGTAEAEALARLDRFVAYRARGRELSAHDDLRDDLAARAEAVRQLRHDVFGADDAVRLFADEDALLAAALAERRIAADATLSPEQRAQQLAALETDLPPAAREARRATTAPLRLAEDVAALRAQGASPEAIQALRVARVGEAAAARLAALDAQRDAWQQRVDTYRAARAAIDADAGLDDAQRSTAVAALRAEHFSGPEQARIAALDSLPP